MMRWQPMIIRLGAVLGLVVFAVVAAQEVKPAPRKPQIWAIVVGINNYIDPLISDSRQAVRDAESVRGWFLRQGGWKLDHILFMADGGNQKPGAVDSPRPNILPIKANLDWVFQKWLPAHVGPEDLVVIYYAGRVGTAVSAEGVLPQPKVSYYLLPRDAKAENVADSGWSLDLMLDRFVRDMGGKCQVVCWLATTLGSRPAVLPVSAPAKPGAGPGVPSGRDWLAHLGRWQGVTAWLASDQPLENVILDEPSAVFTRTLLASLSEPGKKQNLTAVLRKLQQNPELKRKGFQTLGSVPSRLTLWADLYGQPIVAVRPEIVLQVGHADGVTEIVASADGQRFITASRDSTVRVWSLKDGALEHVLSGHEVGATALGWSADERWLVSGGGRPANALLFHELKQDSARIVIPAPVHDRAVRKITMLPDGDHCISLDQDARAFLWNLKAQTPEPQPWLASPVAKPAEVAAPFACLDVACGGDNIRGAVAALGADGIVRICNASGAGVPVLKRWPEPPSKLAIDSGGRWLAVGFGDGHVLVCDLATGAETPRKVGTGRITQLALSSAGLVAVGHEGGLSVFRVASRPEEAAPKTLTGQTPGVLAFSPDGLYLAASARNLGDLQVWEAAGDDPTVVISEKYAGISALAFTGDSHNLIVGGTRGSIKTWKLANRDGKKTFAMPAHQAKVQHLSASPNRRLLLLFNDQHRGQIWDLHERNCRRLPGNWTSGIFAGADDRLILTEAVDATHPGRVVNVLIAREKITADPAFFQTKGAGFEVPEGVAFTRVVLSADGSRVAATAHSSQEPMVCVWDAKSGQLTHWLSAQGLADPVQSLSFSADARYLLTAGDSPDARLWNLAAAQGEINKPIVTFHDTEDPKARNDTPAPYITVAQIQPDNPHQVVTGHSDGRVRLRTWSEERSEQIGPAVDLVVGAFSGKIGALTFASDGPQEYLAAGGDGTSMWFGAMTNRQAKPVNDKGTRPHHHEQINALISWPRRGPGDKPGTAVVISGSDDTTVKFWEITSGAVRLRGSFTPAVGPKEDDLPDDPTATTDLDWVVFTPDGHFDASARGESSITFRHGGQTRPPKQFERTRLYTFDLGQRLISGQPFDAVAPLDEPPPIVIEPPSKIDPDRPETQMTVILGSNRQRDVRLYQNGVPILAGLETEDRTDPRTGRTRIAIPVSLVKGVNQFYAMATPAGREESYDSRSSDVEVNFNGPVDPGQLHVVALGVSDYKRRRLNYPDRDAEQLSEVLHDSGLQGTGKSQGLRIVRKNSDVSEAGVNKAFREVAERVKGRPQDTVVVFLAGHTGIFDDNQFGLLLPSYQFPADEPPTAKARDAVVFRSSSGGRFDPKHVLPYSLIEANLSRLNALNRLVIVDACQAEAIFDDAQVKEIRKWMEIRSRRARTSYLMAARRGEPALEIAGLRHGLFTYTLLRGMGPAALDRSNESSEIRKLNLPDDADFNHDRVITTDELDLYSKRSLPAIAQLFPQMMTRGRDEEAKLRPLLPVIPESELEQNLRFQSNNVSFPLMPLAERTK